MVSGNEFLLEKLDEDPEALTPSVGADSEGLWLSPCFTTFEGGGIGGG